MSAVTWVATAYGVLVIGACAKSSASAEDPPAPTPEAASSSEPHPAGPEPSPPEAPTTDASTSPNETEVSADGYAPEFPPWKVFLRPPAIDGWKAPVKASKRVYLDESRAVAVVRTERGSGAEQRWRISLVRSFRQAGEWDVDAVATIEEWGFHEELGRAGKIAVHVRVGDFDDDGELEIATRHRLDWMCCGAGATRKRTLVILNDDDALNEAAYVDLDEEIYRGATKSNERFEDRNGDGHADLVVSWVSTDEEDPTERGESVHEWQPKRDRYQGAKRPRGEECHCE